MSIYVLQMISSIIPVYSTALIVMITFYRLKKHKAKRGIALLVGINLFVFAIVWALLIDFVINDFSLLWKRIIGILFFAAENFLLIYLQRKGVEERTPPESDKDGNSPRCGLGK
ncbi:MAG: hypothetical protein IKM13_04280 [Clostridia bacterium]|nr:hypothetical protein [Clostridia bacterium]